MREIRVKKQGEVSPEDIVCKRVQHGGPVETLIKITGSVPKISWYEGIEGKQMKVYLYKECRYARSRSLPDLWVEPEHFVVCPGNRDVRIYA